MDLSLTKQKSCLNLLEYYSEEVTRFFMLKLNEYRDRIIEEDGEVF